MSEKAEDEATVNKILSLDNDVIEKYLYYREDEGYFFLGKRRLGALGTRKKTDTVEKYNEDTAFMRKILQDRLQEDINTKKYIDTLDLSKVQDYIQKRNKFTIFKKTNRVEGKFNTRTKLTNTLKNYKFDNIYLASRQKILQNKIENKGKSSSSSTKSRSKSSKKSSKSSKANKGKKVNNRSTRRSTKRNSSSSKSKYHFFY